MQTFEERIEGMTSLAITASSTPTQAELSQFLRDGIKDLIRKLIAYGVPPSLLTTFAKTESITDANGLPSDSNVVFSVTRGDGTIQNPAREIAPSLKGRVTDIDSLNYDSKYNPVFYKEAGKIYIKPDPTSGSVDNGEVLHIVFDNSVSHSSVSISDFPEGSEYLVTLYAAGMSALANANNIHSSLPTKPTAPTEEFIKPSPPDAPSFSVSNPDLPVIPVYSAVSLPTVPTFSPPVPSLDFTDVETEITDEDPEMVDKRMEIVEKRYKLVEKDIEIEIKKFDRDVAEFNKDIDRQLENAKNDFQGQMQAFTKEVDFKLQNASEDLKEQVSEYSAVAKKYELEIGKYTADVNEYKAHLQKYGGEIQQYTAELNEEMAQYKWWMEQYYQFMAQYNNSIVGMSGPAPKEEKEPRKKSRKR